ncbi:porin family protein [Halocola ammonii]
MLRPIYLFIFVLNPFLGFSYLQTDTIHDEESEKTKVEILLDKDLGTSKAEIEGENDAAKELNPDTTWLKVGGAFRLNAIWTHYEGETFPLGTFLRNEFTWDTWRVNFDGYSNGIQFSFEYRFYPTFNTNFIKYGWLGYRFTEKSNLKLGITQVPFGNLTYVSHSWWFQLPYYAGLEDDHQMGLHYRYQTDDWTIDAAYFVMAEPRGTNEASFGAFSTARYSYDVVPIEGNSNIERNQGNIRVVKHWENSELGLSLQGMEIYNQQTQHSGGQVAGALHYEWSPGKWNLKAEGIYYNYFEVRDDENNELNAVQMGAYGFGTYDVASEAAMYVIGLARDFPVDWGPISNIQLYNDYTFMHKFNRYTIDGETRYFVPTQHNVLGALVTAGNLYTYFDLAFGYNHSWISDSFGGSALGIGRGENPSEEVDYLNPPDQSPGWNLRANINFGYYF